MIFKIQKEQISNIPLPYIFYSFLLLIPLIRIFNIPIAILYIAYCLLLFIINKNKLIRSLEIYNADFLSELLCISYSFYFIPKIAKYIIALILCKSLYREFIKNKKEIISRINI